MKYHRNPARTGYLRVVAMKRDRVGIVVFAERVFIKIIFIKIWLNETPRYFAAHTPEMKIKKTITGADAA